MLFVLFRYANITLFFETAKHFQKNIEKNTILENNRNFLDRLLLLLVEHLSIDLCSSHVAMPEQLR